MRTPHLVLAAFALAIPATAFAHFSDVSTRHSNYAAIEAMEERGLISGYADGTFRPNNSVSRVEFLKIVLGASVPPQALTYCDPNHIYDFPDASRTAWYSPYLCAAVQHQVVGGYPDGSFKPESPVTFVEAAKMLTLASHIYSADWAPPIALPKIGGAWYVAYAHALTDAQYVPVSVKRLDQALTRGEVAEIVDRWLSGEPQDSYRRYDELAGASETLTFSDAQLGVTFGYQSAWGEPRVTWAEQGDSWRIDLGPVCEGCAEGTDTSTYSISGISSVKAGILLADIRTQMAQGMASILRDTSRSDGLRLIEYTEGGMCGYRSVLLIGELRAVKISGFCLEDNADAWEQLVPVIDSLSLFGEEPAGVPELAFDACGDALDYGDRDWFEGFIEKVRRSSLPDGDDGWVYQGDEVFDSLQEGCLSLDGSTFIAIWNGGYCQESTVIRYDTERDTLTLAERIGVLTENTCATLNEFGKRDGSIVSVYGTWGDAGCSSRNTFAYDLRDDTVSLVSMCSRCEGARETCENY